MASKKKSASKVAPNATAPASSETPGATPPYKALPIVGIGASAGGLEAFEQFFRHTPADSGMAYVLVQHLDPEHVSLLTEILQRTTSMPVVEAVDQMVVAANHVYIIPPNRDMAIYQGALQLSVPEQPRGQRLPIDAFLRSLAEEQGERAIGIILSGTGSDGTLGLRAIIGAGGISLVQEPTSARYDGMPSSAIRAGYATQVLPVEDMPAALHTSLHQIARRLQVRPASATVVGMKRILMLLRSATGHDFSHYKTNTIGRRIERRMAQHDIEDTETYARYLKDNPSELHVLFRELLINVTSFFRDPEAFVILEQEILPQLLQDKGDDKVVRIWVAGCATGEEAYSIAILLREYMDLHRRNFKLQLYATDLDDEAIAIARAGIYPANIAQDIQPERLRRFFLKEDAGYRVKTEIREMLVFAVQNIIKDPPFTKLDLLCCRNLLIYLEPELQDRIMAVFHYALNPGGILFLSPSESIGHHADLFSAQHRKWKFYRASHATASTRAIMASDLSWVGTSANKMPIETIKTAKVTNLAELAGRLLLQSYAPASVVTDLKGNILYVHGDTGKYLRPAPGKATLNVAEMAREGLQLEVRTALLQIANQGIPTVGRELSIDSADASHRVIFSLRPLPDAETGETLLLMSFQEQPHAVSVKPKRGKVKPSSVESERFGLLEQELAYTKENLQATIEAQQATNEELHSSNEEMQSTNEELQSANEELETSREELQSVNEELVTVNAELQAKVEQLACVQNDVKNLLDNLSVGTIFLDEQLVIRRFTQEAVRAYHLIASDVGRPLADIKSKLLNDDLLTRAQTVLDSLIPYESEYCTESGAWFLTRIQPYRTLNNIIQGVVLTCTDISSRVAAERALQAARDLADGIVNTVREPLLVLDSALRVIAASRSFYRSFQVMPEDTLGRPLYDLGNRQWDIPKLRELLETILPRDQCFEDYRVENDFPGIGRRSMLLNARRILGKSGTTQLILLAMQDAD